MTPSTRRVYRSHVALILLAGLSGLLFGLSEASVILPVPSSAVYALCGIAMLGCVWRNTDSALLRRILGQGNTVLLLSMLTVQVGLTAAFPHPLTSLANTLVYLACGVFAILIDCARVQAPRWCLVSEIAVFQLVTLYNVLNSYLLSESQIDITITQVLGQDVTLISIRRRVYQTVLLTQLSTVVILLRGRERDFMLFVKERPRRATCILVYRRNESFESDRTKYSPTRAPSNDLGAVELTSARMVEIPVPEAAPTPRKPGAQLQRWATNPFLKHQAPTGAPPPRVLNSASVRAMRAHREPSRAVQCGVNAMGLIFVLINIPDTVLGSKWDPPAWVLWMWLLGVICLGAALLWRNINPKGMRLIRTSPSVWFFIFICTINVAIDARYPSSDRSLPYGLVMAICGALIVLLSDATITRPVTVLLGVCPMFLAATLANLWQVHFTSHGSGTIVGQLPTGRPLTGRDVKASVFSAVAVLTLKKALILTLETCRGQGQDRYAFMETPVRRAHFTPGRMDDASQHDTNRTIMVVVA